jgi:hypothetical protein
VLIFATLSPEEAADNAHQDAASYPLPPACRRAFLEHCARELARLPVVGDGAVHRVVMTQRLYFDLRLLLAGPEHGRTIPLPDIESRRFGPSRSESYGPAQYFQQPLGTNSRRASAPGQRWRTELTRRG